MCPAGRGITLPSRLDKISKGVVAIVSTFLNLRIGGAVAAGSEVVLGGGRRLMLFVFFREGCFCKEPVFCCCCCWCWLVDEGAGAPCRGLTSAWSLSRFTPRVGGCVFCEGGTCASCCFAGAGFRELQ